jgi:low temperature requirement protein LtrA
VPRRAFWETPRVHTEGDRDQHRAVTWLDLFFDLFFVVVVAQVTHEFAANITWAGLATFVAQFVPVFWMWIASTYYCERFETQGFEMRLITYILMICAAGLAIFAHDGMTKNYVGFLGSYMASRAFMCVLWSRAAVYVPGYRPVARVLVPATAIGLALYTVSMFQEGPLRYALFAAGLACDILPPTLTASAQQRELPRITAGHFPERFGLFGIICLGEAVLGVVSGLSGTKALTGPQLFATVVGIGICCLMWAVYFDFIARRPFRGPMSNVLAWMYLHFPLYMAIAASGAAILKTIEAITQPGEPFGAARGFLFVAVGTFLLSAAVLETRLLRKDDEPTHPVVSPAVKAAPGLALLAAAPLLRVGPGPALAVAALGLAIPSVYGLYVWFTQDLAETGIDVTPDEAVTPS